MLLSLDQGDFLIWRQYVIYKNDNSMKKEVIFQTIRYRKPIDDETQHTKQSDFDAQIELS